MQQTTPRFRQPVLVLGTGNPHKVEEFTALLRGLGLSLTTPRRLGFRQLAEERGSTPAAIARSKAVFYARRLEHWVLADDTALHVDALGGFPGVHTARYAGPGATAEQNRRLLLAQLAGIDPEQRTARFVCHLVLADPRGTIRAESEGRCCGQILLAPRGPAHFGYDCLFELPEYHRTLAQLGPVAKAVLTHRGRAVQKMLPAIGRLVVPRSDDDACPRPNGVSS